MIHNRERPKASFIFIIAAWDGEKPIIVRNSFMTSDELGEPKIANALIQTCKGVCEDKTYLVCLQYMVGREACRSRDEFREERSMLPIGLFDLFGRKPGENTSLLVQGQPLSWGRHWGGGGVHTTRGMWRISLCVLVAHKYIHSITYFTLVWRQ
jgi:hypothetical protein